MGQLVENLSQSNVFIKRKTSGSNSSEYNFECADEDSSRFQRMTFGRSSYIKHVSQPLGLPWTDLGHHYISAVYLALRLNLKRLGEEWCPAVSDECLEYSF